MEGRSDLNNITKEIVDAVLHLLEDKVYKIVLYGSYARGDFSFGSDIDIMILLNCSKDEVKSFRNSVSKLASQISLNHDVEVSLLLRDRVTFEQKLDIMPFYQNVENDGVALYG